MFSDKKNIVSPRHVRWDGQPWRVMVVEDDGDISEAVRDVLEDEEYDVVVAENGKAALGRLHAEKIPDIIVLDLRMPVMDGWEFRALQKDDPQLKAIPIIACSADASPQAVAISADAYLKKPLDATQLVATIERLLHQQELQHMAQRLESAERLASLGRLAAGVGHEINNPLAFAMLNVSMALKKLMAPGDEVKPDVVGMLKETEVGLERIRQTVERLQKLSRNVQKRPERFDLKVIIEQSIAMARTHIQHRARLSKHYRGSDMTILGDSVAIGQLFLNLLVNAAQAIPDGDADHNEIVVSTDVVGDEIVVELRDTGAGIAPEHLPHVFEPFFTTKPLGIGTGLGLAIARQIITDHRGHIELDSTLGIGTTVRVYFSSVAMLDGDLPDSESVPVRVAPVKELCSTEGARGRVLVIDDEPLIGRVIVVALKEEQDVVVETRASDALARLESGETFDLILCDLAMPNLGGAEVSAIVSARWPDMVPRMVFMTGGAFTASTQAFLDNTTSPVLAKPFTVDDVRRLARTHGVRQATRA